METKIEMLKAMDESHFEGYFCFVGIFPILGGMASVILCDVEAPNALYSIFFIYLR